MIGPQHTNVQLAPCQNPLTRKIIMVALRMVFPFAAPALQSGNRYNHETMWSAKYANGARTLLQYL